MKIVWAPNAKMGFDSNVDYLNEEFGTQSALKFIEKIKECEDLLKKQPNIGAKDENLGCRKLLVVKQVYMLYSVEKKTNEIFILSIWNNYQRPFWS